MAKSLLFYPLNMIVINKIAICFFMSSTLLCFEKQHTIYYQLAIQFDLRNKIADQNSQILKMKLILHVITLAALTSYHSVSALKCYKCVKDTNTDKK